MDVEWCLDFDIILSIKSAIQEKGWIGDGYIKRSGFLALGEANNIVMLFPQVLINLMINDSQYVSIFFQIKHKLLQGNPNGCWDWWGYLGLSDLFSFKYATKQGEQMAGVAKMVEKVATISMF